MQLIRKLVFSGMTLLVVILSSGWLMHKFYVSLTEVRYNPERECFELSMRIFPDDLDLALMERHGIASLLATEKEHADADSLLMVYLLEGFSMEVNGEQLSLHYLGKEAESDAIWCYLESSRVSTPESLDLRNAVLTDYFPDQVNIVQVYHEKWNKGLLLDLNDSKGSLIIGQ